MSQVGSVAVPVGIRPWRRIRQRAWAQRYTAALCAISLAGGILRGWGLGTKSLWIDETFTIGMVRQSWPSFAHTIMFVQPNMELFYGLMKLWVTLTPADWQAHEWFWRCLPALWGTMAIPATYVLARRLGPPSLALLAATFVASNTFLIEYSQQARGYTLFVLLAILATLALVCWLGSATMGGHGDRRALAAFGVLMVLSFLTQAFALVFLVGQLAFAVGTIRTQRRARWVALAVALVPLALVVGLRYPIYAAHPDQVAWIPRPTTHDLLRGLQQLSGGDGGPPTRAGLVLLALVGAAIFSLAVSMIAGLRRTANTPWEKGAAIWSSARGGMLVLMWITLPVGGTWLVSQVKPLWVTRYLAPASIAIDLALATAIWLGARAVHGHWARYGITLALAGLVLGVGAFPLRDYLVRPGWEDWRGAARHLDNRFQPDDGIICYDNQWGCDFGFSAYFARATLDPGAPGAFSWATYARPDREAIFAQAVDPAALAPYLMTHRRVWVLLGHDTNGQGDWRAGIVWLDKHATRIARTVFAGDVVVALYQALPAS